MFARPNGLCFTICLFSELQTAFFSVGVEMRPMRAIPRKSRPKTPTTQREEQGAEKEGDHRHSETGPRRRLQHRRILAFVPTNSPNRDIQGGNTTSSSRGSAEGCNKRLPPDREQYTQQPQTPQQASPSQEHRHGEAPGALLAVESPLHSTLANRNIRPCH